MSDLVERLREASVGMGTRNPEDYTFMLTVAEAIEEEQRIAAEIYWEEVLEYYKRKDA